MAELRFEWHEGKNASNRRKHRVSFEEAQTTFYDDHALLIPDPEHSAMENRFVLLGVSSTLRVLVVCHCYREGHSLIRIISARKANKAERADYERKVSP